MSDDRDWFDEWVRNTARPTLKGPYTTPPTSPIIIRERPGRAFLAFFWVVYVLGVVGIIVALSGHIG